MARKTLYLTDNQVLEKLKLEANESKYVTNLILNDIQKNPKITEKDIISLIKKYIEQEKNNPLLED